MYIIYEFSHSSFHTHKHFIFEERQGGMGERGLGKAKKKEEEEKNVNMV